MSSLLSAGPAAVKITGFWPNVPSISAIAVSTLPYHRSTLHPPPNTIKTVLSSLSEGSHGRFASPCAGLNGIPHR